MNALHLEIKTEWEKIVDDLYLLLDEWDFKKAKRLVKKINVYEKKIERKRREITTTLKLTEFHENKLIADELEAAILFIDDTLSLLTNITTLEPKQEKGYRNYITNAIAFLDK